MQKASGARRYRRSQVTLRIGAGVKTPISADCSRRSLPSADDCYGGRPLHLVHGSVLITEPIFWKLRCQLPGFPGPATGLARAHCGIMLHTLIVRLDQVDAEKQRRVHRVGRFAGEISEIVKTTQPVTLLPKVTITTALAGRIKQAVVGTVLIADILQYKQTRIRKCLK